MSKGAQKLLEIVQQIYPNQQMVFEYNVALVGALFIDIYLPRFQIGFEFDGELHFKYNTHYHGSRENFLKAQKRDIEKDELCEQKGITLIRVAHFEEMSKDLVLDKIEEAQNASE